MKKLSALTSVILLYILAACSPAAAPTATFAPTIAPTTAPATAPAALNCPPCLKAYVMPDAGVQLISRAIDGAQRSIKLTMYLFTEPTLVDALRRAASRSVEVRVLMEQNPFGGGDSNRNVFNALNGTGVKWQWTDNSVYKYTHEKSMVIDDQIAYIMSNNFTTSSFTANREYGIVDTNPADVAEIVRVFEADWGHTKPDLSNARLVWSPVNARAKLVALIEEAKVSLDTEQAEMQDAEIGTHLLSAIKRGVQVRLVSSPNDPLSQDANEKQRDDLRKSGAQVRYLRSPYIHAKMFLIDGKKAFVGSENNSTNSLDNNRELGIIFDDAEAIKLIASAFEKDFAAATKDAFPVSGATLPPNKVVNAKDAATYYNQTVTLEGTVQSTYNSGRVIWLIMGVNQKTDFKVVIFPDDWPKFPSVPDKLYQGKTLRVTGKVQEYQNAPEMIIRDPSAITVISQ